VERRDEEVVMMRIAVLGPLEVHDDGGRPVEVSGRRLRALLVRLALDAGRLVSADRLIDDLWEDEPPAGAANALQSLVSRLRGLLGRDLVESAGGGYRLALDPAQLDLAVFEHSVRDGRAALGRGDRSAAAVALRRASDLWRGPALDDVAQAPFAAAEIARLEELRVTAAEDRVEAEFALGDPARYVPELEALRAAHPLRERIVGQLMQALCAAGRPAQALEVYEDLRRALADRLGADPSAGLSALHVAILRGEPFGSAGPVTRSVSQDPQTAASAPASAPGSPSAAPARSGNLPAQITSFVGREEEIGRLGALLAEARLITLTGPGGAGKTRLAIEAAAGQVGRARDGVWFVPLAAVTDPIDVPQAIAAAVGLADPIRLSLLTKEPLDPVSPLNRLADLLAGQQLIIILDNCEHVIEAAAALADRVLAAAPGVRILATSREPLAITGEMLCPVASLAMPPEDADAATAVEHASVQLFAERARAVRPGFRVEAGNAAAVVRICRALDGIPLAIELAAARLRALSVQQVADRLDDRFRLLSNGSRAALPRHQTLRAIVDWSWDLLGPAERRVLRRLAVFSGGATPEAAQRLSGGEYDDAAEPGDVIDVIAALVDKSLVLADEDGGVRYRLLETVRAYAAERLAEAGEEAALRDAHAAYFLELSERAEPHLRRSGQKEWVGVLTLEQGNCNAALRHAIDSGDVPTALRYIRGLTWFWLISGYESEATTWAVEVADLAGGTAPPGLEEAHAVCRLFAAVTGATHEHMPQLEVIGRELAEVAAALPDAVYPLLAIAPSLSLVLAQDEAGARRELERLDRHPDPWIQAMRHTVSGMLDVTGAQPDSGEVRLREGYARFEQVGDRFGLVLSLTFLVEVALARGRFDEAVRLATEARRLAAGFGGEGEAMQVVMLGRAHVWAGQIELGRGEMEEGVREGLRTGEFGDAVSGMAELAALALRFDDRELARQWLDRGAQTVSEHSGRPDIGLGAATMDARRAYLAVLDGDLEFAEDCYAQAFEKVRKGTIMLFTAAGIGEIALGLAALAGRRGQHERAAELLGCAHSVYGLEFQASYCAGPAREAALAALGTEAFEVAYLRGRRRPRERVLALEARPAAGTPVPDAVP
jgi:predicted ATPase/DNA-binding SARP family transcriptional activator